jgi:hypothetical protein
MDRFAFHFSQVVCGSETFVLFLRTCILKGNSSLPIPLSLTAEKLLVVTPTKLVSCPSLAL